MNEWMAGSPGYSLRRLLTSMSLEQIGRLLDCELVEILRLIRPELTEREALVDAALELNEPEYFVRDSECRKLLLQQFPLRKAEELLRRLGENVGRNPFRQLERRYSSPSSEDLGQLLAFCGVGASGSKDRSRTRDKGVREQVDPEYSLFPYQRLTLQDLWTALAQSRTALVHMPTGSGKTRTTMHYIARHLHSGGGGLVFWLSEQPEVLDQSAEAFATAWGHLGDRKLPIYRLYGSGACDVDSMHSGFVAGGFQKLYSMQQVDENLLLRLGDRTHLVVVDEAHQAVAPTYSSVIRGLARKRPDTKLIGLTATPGRSWADVEEDYRLSEFFEGRKVVLKTGDERNPIRFLMEEGYLSRPTFRHIELGGVEEHWRHGGLNNVRLIEEILDMLDRHSRILVFASSVEHAKLLSSVFKFQGVSCGVVTADTPTVQREYLYRKFRGKSQESMVLFNYGVLTTGFDAPVASGAVIARSTRSLVLFSQMVGRVLRGPEANGTERAEILTTVNTDLPGFGSVREAFSNWEDVWDDERTT